MKFSSINPSLGSSYKMTNRKRTFFLVILGEGLNGL